MSKRVNYHQQFNIIAKKLENNVGKKVAKQVDVAVKDILNTARELALSYPNQRYATGKYANSFRMSLGKSSKSSDTSGFFGGAGYTSSSTTINYGTLKTAKYISIYNIASKEYKGRRFRYAMLVDYYGWKNRLRYIDSHYVTPPAGASGSNIVSIPDKNAWFILNAVSDRMVSKYPFLKKTTSSIPQL